MIPISSFPSFTLSLWVCLLLSAACTKSAPSPGSDSKDPDTAAGPTGMGADEAPTNAAAGTHALLEDLRMMVNACTFDDKTVPSVECYQKMTKRMSTEEHKALWHRAPNLSLEALSQALGAADPKAYQVAASVFNNLVGDLVARSREGQSVVVDRAAVVRLLNLAGQLKAREPEITLAIPLTRLALLAGLEKELFALADSMGGLFQAAVIRFSMREARMTVFPRIRDYVQSGSPEVKKAALKAANLPDPTPEEKAVLCPWARSLLHLEVPEQLATVFVILATCGGEHVDALLTRAEALPSGAFASGMMGAFSALMAHLTAAGAVPGDPVSVGQQARLQKLLFRIIEDEKAPAELRAGSIRAFGNDPLGTEVKTFLSRFAAHKELPIRKAVEKVLKK